MRTDSGLHDGEELAGLHTEGCGEGRDVPDAGVDLRGLDGVLTCPCLGARGPGQQVAELAVDDDGQLVWSALGSNNQPVAYHTFVAMRRDAGGQLRPVVLKAGQKPQLNTQGGVGFFALLDAQDNGGNVTVDELMTRALAGEEFVLLH